MTRSVLLLSLVVGLFLAPGADAQVRRSTAVSWLHEALLDRAPVIVRARFVEERRIPFGGEAAGVFEVKKTLRGAKVGKRVLVGGMGDRLGAFPDLDQLLFLDPLESGVILRLVDLVDLTPNEAPYVERLVERFLALDPRKDAISRRKQRLEIGLDAIGTGSVFASRVGVLELERVFDEQPGLFGRGQLARIQAAESGLPPAARADHERLVRRLGARIGDPFAGTELPFRPGPEREFFRDLLVQLEALRGREADRAAFLAQAAERVGPRLGPLCAALLGDEELPIRLAAARWLGEFGRASGVGPLLGKLETLRGDERRVRIEALGKLGARPALGVLLPLLSDASDGVVVAEALARIGGRRARQALEGRLARLQDEGGQAEAVAALRALLAPDFERRELKRRLEAARRWR